VIERTRPLAPFAYIVHLDGQAIQSKASVRALARWQSQAARSLEQVAVWTGDPSRVCVENLENYDPAALAPVLDAVPVSRCVDVGHLWRQGRDPLPYLAQWKSRTRVIHLHGIHERDHQSLAKGAPPVLDPVVKYLVDHLRGVVTLEVFGVDDFLSSLSALESAVERVRMR